MILIVRGHIISEEAKYAISRRRRIANAAYCVVKVFTGLVTPSLLPLASIDSTV